MPKYLVEDSKTGRKYQLEGDSPPTESELAEIFDAQDAQEPSGAEPTPETTHPLAKLGETVLEGGKGALKGLGETVQGAGKLMNRVVPAVGALSGGDVGAAYDAISGKTPGLGDYIMPGALDQKLAELQASNPTQEAGKSAERVAEFFVPGGSGGALSNAAKAALVASTQEGEVGPGAVTAALASGAVSGIGKGASSLAKLIENNATARAVAEAASKTGVGAKELLGAGLGAYHGRNKGAVGMAGEAALGGLGANKAGGLKELLTTPAGQRLFASILAKIGAASGGLAPLAGAGGAALGRAMARLKGSTIGSTEYARDER